MGKLILAVFMAVSFRSANAPDSPTDYEVSGGAKGKYYSAQALTERENGAYYSGCDVSGTSPAFFKESWGIGEAYYQVSGKWYAKEARGINTQTVSIDRIMPMGFRYGLTNSWIDWKDYRPMVYAGVEGSLVKYVVRVGKGRYMSSFRIGREFPVSKGFYIEPFLKAESVNDNDFWQAKVQVGWKI